jgi:hypothetical protein
MVRLKDIAKVIRSKNAGSWHVTFDVMVTTHPLECRVDPKGPTE